MPELPEVEGFGRILDEHAVGRTVDDVEVLDAGVLHGVSARRFEAAIRGLEFQRSERHGKWLLAQLGEGPVLVFHFGMTGELLWSETEKRHPHDRVLFSIGAGTLVYRDQRKLQGLWLAEAEGGVTGITGRLGPDALGLDKETLAEQLAGRRGAVKTALMDQRIVAGIGNILADEILWRARIHPARRCDNLSPDELARVAESLKRVLRTSVREDHVPSRRRWLSTRRGEKDALCPRCQATLSTSRINGRTALWCPRCQAPGAGS